MTRTAWEDGVAESAAEAAAGGMQVLFTETSAGLDNKAYDAPFAASFIVHASAALLSIPNVPTMSVRVGGVSSGQLVLAGGEPCCGSRGEAV